MGSFYNWLQERRASAIAQDSDFKEEDHPRNDKGGTGGGRFRTSGKTIEKEDAHDSGEGNQFKKFRHQCGAMVHSPEHGEMIETLCEFLETRDNAKSKPYSSMESVRLGERATRLANDFRKRYESVYGKSFPSTISLFDGLDSQIIKEVNKEPAKKTPPKSHGFSSTQIQEFLKESGFGRHYSEKDIDEALEGKAALGLAWEVKNKIPVRNHPAYSSLMDRLHPIIRAIVKRNNIVRN